MRLTLPGPRATLALLRRAASRPARKEAEEPCPWTTRPSSGWPRSCAGTPSSPRPRPAPGHPTTCMSCAEIMSVLFFDEMRFDPARPERPGRGRVRALEGPRGADPVGRAQGGGRHRRRPAHPAPLRQPARGPSHAALAWVRVATGSLGQGLCAAAGMAWARKLDGAAGRVYALLGDGEAAEGSVWEAAQFASFYKLDNLCAIVDVNRLGQSGPTMYEHDMGVYEARLRAFGWDAVAVDGHDVAALRGAFARGARHDRQAVRDRGPHASRARASRSCEDKEGWHGKPVKKGEELQKAVAELGDTDVTIRVEPRRYPPSPRPRTAALDLTPAYKLGPGSGHARGLRHGPRQARQGAPGRGGDRRRHQELHLQRALQGGGARALRRRATSPSRTWWARRWAWPREGKIPFASTFACFLTPRLRLHPHGRLLAAAAPRARGQPRRASRSARTGRRRWRSRTWP